MIKIPNKFSSPILYTTSSLINAILAFASSVYIARNISVTDYGLTTNIITGISVIVAFVGFQFESAISVFYYKRKNDIYTFFAHIWYIFLSIAIILFFGVLLFLNEISAYLNITNNLVLISLFSVYVLVINAYLFTVLNVTNRRKEYFFFSVFRAVLDLSLSVYFIIYIDDHVFSRILAYLLSNLIVSICIVLRIRQKYIFPKISVKTIKVLILYSSPLIVHAAIGVMLSAVDRFFLTKFNGLTDVGHYSVAFQIASVYSLVSSSLNLAWVPWFNSVLANYSQENKVLLGNRIISLILLLLFGCVSLSLISKYLINIFYGDKYSLSGSYVTIILSGFFFQACYYIFVNFILFENKTFLLMKIDIVLLVTKIFISYFFIKEYGTFGAAISYTITFLLYTILVFYFSKSAYRLNYFKEFKVTNLFK
jgi:O-antigen/teichoic acid export membrane protein